MISLLGCKRNFKLIELIIVAFMEMTYHKLVSRKSNTNPSLSLSSNVEFYSISSCSPSSNILTIFVIYITTAHWCSSKTCSYMIEINYSISFVWLCFLTYGFTVSSICTNSQYNRSNCVICYFIGVFCCCCFNK